MQHNSQFFSQVIGRKMLEKELSFLRTSLTSRLSHNLLTTQKCSQFRYFSRNNWKRDWFRKIVCKGCICNIFNTAEYVDCVKRIWYLSPMRAAKVQASLRIRAVSPEPSLLAHTSSESRGTFRQIARSLAPLNGWACAVKICHGGMLEDTNSLDGAHVFS